MTDRSFSKQLMVEIDRQQPALEKELVKKGAIEVARMTEELREELPIDTGKLRESVGFKRKRTKGFPGWTIYADSPIAHLVEGGTGVDTDPDSAWGPYTPTEPDGAFARLALRYKGFGPDGPGKG